MDALSPLGMVSDAPNEIEQKDYFVEKDGVKFAGTHLLLDLWGASNLTDPELIDRALRDAAEAADATILHSHFHHFGPNGGVSGVLVLAESHISIHTWPERDFAAVDIFMCGACDPYHSLPVLKERVRAEVDPAVRAAAAGRDRVRPSWRPIAGSTRRCTPTGASASW